MPSHIHFILGSNSDGLLADIIIDLKSYTSRSIRKLLEDHSFAESRREWLLFMFQRIGKKIATIKLSVMATALPPHSIGQQYHHGSKSRIPAPKPSRGWFCNPCQSMAIQQCRSLRRRKKWFYWIAVCGMKWQRKRDAFRIKKGTSGTIAPEGLLS